MRKFTPVEISGMILGAFLFTGGLALVIWPRAGLVDHFTNDVSGMSPGYTMEVVGISGARVCGTLAMLLGVALVAVAVYREKS